MNRIRKQMPREKIKSRSFRQNGNEWLWRDQDQDQYGEQDETARAGESDDLRCAINSWYNQISTSQSTLPSTVAAGTNS